MKHLAIILLLSTLTFAEGVRVGDERPLMTTASISGTTVLVPVVSASIQFCTSPANAVPCTNKATTYTDKTLGTPCSTSTQVVLAGTTSCVANADALGNWGVWVASANYEYTFCNSAGACFGPYPITANSSPNVNGWSSLTAPTANLSLTMPATHTTLFSWTATPAATNKVWGISPLNAAASNPTGLFVLGSGEVLLGSSNGLTTNFANPLSVGSLGTHSSSNPPVQNKLVCLNSTGQAQICSTSSGSGPGTVGSLIGICTQNCNSSSGTYVSIAIAGTANCIFDNATAAGDWVVVSSGVTGDCHDSGSATPPATTVSAVGHVLSSNGAAGTYLVWLQIAR